MIVLCKRVTVFENVHTAMKKYHQHRQKEYRLLLWGGNANNGANCGLVYSNSNNAWTNAWTNIGSRHTIQGNARRLYVLSDTPEPCIRILPHSGCHEQKVSDGKTTCSICFSQECKKCC